MSAHAKNMSGLIFLKFYDIQPGKYFSGEGFMTEKRYTYDRQPSPRRDGTSVTQYFKLAPTEFVTWY